jgi:hypothetical protein
MFRRLVFSISVILALLVSVAGVSSHIGAFAQQQTKKSSGAALAPPATALAGFTVNVTYSQKAMDKLVASKETVIVVGYLYGFPKAGTPKRDVDHVGQVDLGEVKQEIAPAATATFDRVKPDQALMKWVNNQGLQILINVYSGRKSSPNNLLDCGIYEGSLAAVQGQSIPISCKLIGE